jgi:hypothetical protein
MIRGSLRGIRIGFRRLGLGSDYSVMAFGMY